MDDTPGKTQTGTMGTITGARNSGLQQPGPQVSQVSAIEITEAEGRVNGQIAEKAGPSEVPHQQTDEAEHSNPFRIESTWIPSPASLEEEQTQQTLIQTETMVRESTRRFLLKFLPQQEHPNIQANTITNNLLDILLGLFHRRTILFVDSTMKERYDVPKIISGTKMIRNLVHHGRPNGLSDRLCLHVLSLAIDFLELIGDRVAGEIVMKRYTAILEEMTTCTVKDNMQQEKQRIVSGTMERMMKVDTTGGEHDDFSFPNPHPNRPLQQVPPSSLPPQIISTPKNNSFLHNVVNHETQPSQHLQQIPTSSLRQNQDRTMPPTEPRAIREQRPSPYPRMRPKEDGRSLRRGGHAGSGCRDRGGNMNTEGWMGNTEFDESINMSWQTGSSAGKGRGRGRSGGGGR